MLWDFQWGDRLFGPVSDTFLIDWQARLLLHQSSTTGGLDSLPICHKKHSTFGFLKTNGHFALLITYRGLPIGGTVRSSFLGCNPAVFSSQDLELISKHRSNQESHYRAQVRQQGDYESLHRDLMISFETWEFDPMDLENPFPNNEGSVHLWQGDEDKPSPAILQSYIAQQLPWIKYHELTGSGHLVPMLEGMGVKTIKALLAG